MDVKPNVSVPPGNTYRSALPGLSVEVVYAIASFSPTSLFVSTEYGQLLVSFCHYGVINCDRDVRKDRPGVNARGRADAFAVSIVPSCCGPVRPQEFSVVSLRNYKMFRGLRFRLIFPSFQSCFSSLVAH